MNPLSSRNVSSNQLSVGTGSALEAFFQNSQTAEGHKSFWFNGLTLIRNIYSACPKEVANDVSPLDLTETFLQEIDQIRSLLKNEGNELTKPFIYFNSYESFFNKDNSFFKLREDKTNIQKKTRYVYEKTKEMVLRQDPEILKFNLKLKNETGDKTLILTHVPIDLLSQNCFKTLELVESHTGKIKTKFEWYSKYHSCGDEDLRRLPFCRQLLSCFGDNSVIVPLPIKARKEILEIAKKAKWNPSTTQSKVSLDLKQNLKDVFLWSVLKNIPLF